MIEIMIAWQQGTQAQERTLSVPQGTSLRRALWLASQQNILPEALDWQATVWGIWGKRQKDWSVTLSEGDRLEQYEGLRIDPMVARRMRLAKSTQR